MHSRLILRSVARQKRATGPTTTAASSAAIFPSRSIDTTVVYMPRRFYQFDSPGTAVTGGFGFGNNNNTTSAATWPRSMWNTVICICPPGENLVIERIDGHVDVAEPGMRLLVPFIHKIKYRVDMREMAIEIPPQKTITKDNVSVTVSGYIYVQVRRPPSANSI